MGASALLLLMFEVDEDDELGAKEDVEGVSSRRTRIPRAG